MDNFYLLLAVAFCCGALFKLGDSLADLVIEIVKYVFVLIKRKIKK